MKPTPTVLIVDDLAPEDGAMLQAWYSRSAVSVTANLEKARQLGSGKFMAQFYVNYNHKSIADCGSTTIFCEGVSLLAAKAIQDWPLYAGQETSTRYIDMTRQPIVDPLATPEAHAILIRWMDFYTSQRPDVEARLRVQHPRLPEEDAQVYERAIKARSFDIMRGFLPAGITTQLSWHTNLRQAGDHLTLLAHHPAEEIRTLTAQLRQTLGERYVSSREGLNLPAVSGIADAREPRALERVRWEQQVAAAYTYPPPLFAAEDATARAVGRADAETLTFWTDVHAQLFEDQYLLPYANIITQRPRGCVLPHFMSDLGQLHFDFLLDFGSFRDIQRHRNGVCRMPLLTTDHGFEPWYIEQLGDGALREAAQRLVEQQAQAIRQLTDDGVLRQYYTALGFRVPTSLSYALPAALYVMELRSSKTVHPTLRRRVHQMVEAFTRRYPWIPVHADRDPDDWTIRRGAQTITEKL